MSAKLETPATARDPDPGHRHKSQGLRNLPPDLISKAIDETNDQIVRVGFTLIGTTAFCLLSLLSPDSALLSGSERINVPLAGPVSFFGFMLLAPAVLITLRIYLQLFVEHSNRLKPLGQLIRVTRPPTLVPLKNPLMRMIGGLTFFLLLPLTMPLFAWRAAVFPTWGTSLFGLATAVIASHLLLRYTKSWRSNVLWSIAVGALTVIVLFSLGPVRRPFDLYHANLSNQWLARDDLRGADLSLADLSGAKLLGTDLTKANLYGANLVGATLAGATLHRANLEDANLSGSNMQAYFSDANLSGANMSGADLFYADLPFANLSHANLSNAKMHGANLRSANMTIETNLTDADLSGARLSDAKIDTANLSGADLSGANLIDASMKEANLSGANLSGANLSGVDLSGANLSQARNLADACGDERTKLPTGFAVKACEY